VSTVTKVQVLQQKLFSVQDATNKSGARNMQRNVLHFYWFIPLQKKEHLLDIILYILCISVLPHRNSN